MDKELLRQVQLTQLEIANEIKRVCDENEIDYFMDGGTLIGAVRHKGFIPWDDDMDFGMIREQYEKFLTIAPEKLKKQYFLQTWYSDTGYGLPFAKVRKNETLYVEEITEKCKCHQGVFVDIFPYDYLPDNSSFRKKQKRILTFSKLIIRAKCGFRPVYASRKFELKRYLSFVPFRLLALVLPKRMITKIYDSTAKKYNTEKSGCLFVQGISKYAGFTVEDKILRNLIELPFENTTFKAPIQYDEYLTNVYGDYMTPPPETERSDRHQVKKIKL